MADRPAPKPFPVNGSRRALRPNVAIPRLYVNGSSSQSP